jgi:hypothetical protein
MFCVGLFGWPAEGPTRELSRQLSRQKLMTPLRRAVGPITVMCAVAACGATTAPATATSSAATAMAAPSSTQPRTTAGDTTPVSTELPSQPLGQDAAMSCVEEYDLTTLVGRAFAFDGTVAEIAEDTSSGDNPYIDVTFDVYEWFAGGGPHTLNVEMFPPGIRTSVGTVDYDVGSRLLVSGEPRWGGTPLESPVGWMCGFSRTYDTDTAATWREAFHLGE